MKQKVFIQTDIKETLPEKDSKVIVFTKTLLGSNAFRAKFTGKTFDVSGQMVTSWLKEEEKFIFDKDELKQLLLDFWNGAGDYYDDTSDFPMGDCKKEAPDFEEMFSSLSK